MAKMKDLHTSQRDRRAIFEKSLVLSLGLFLLVLLAWQSVEIKAYQKGDIDSPIEVIDIPKTQQLQKKPPQLRPAVYDPVDEEDVVLPPEKEIIPTDPTQYINPEQPPPPPEQDEPPEFIVVEEMPNLIRYAKPYYPEMAQKAGLECDVIIYILVDEKGDPAKVKIAKQCGKAGFNEAAEEAAWKCKFTPGKQNDQPVRVWVSIPFRFKLR